MVANNIETDFGYGYRHYFFALLVSLPPFLPIMSSIHHRCPRGFFNRYRFRRNHFSCYQPVSFLHYLRFFATYMWLVKGVQFFRGWLSVAAAAGFSLVINPVAWFLVMAHLPCMALWRWVFFSSRVLFYISLGSLMLS